MPVATVPLFANTVFIVVTSFALIKIAELLYVAGEDVAVTFAATVDAL